MCGSIVIIHIEPCQRLKPRRPNLCPFGSIDALHKGKATVLFREQFDDEVFIGIFNSIEYDGVHRGRECEIIERATLLRREILRAVW